MRVDLGGEETMLVGLADAAGVAVDVEDVRPRTTTSLSKMPLRLRRVRSRESSVVVRGWFWLRLEVNPSRRGKGVRLRIWRPVMCLMRLWCCERWVSGEREGTYRRELWLHRVVT